MRNRNRPNPNSDNLNFGSSYLQSWTQTMNWNHQLTPTPITYNSVPSIELLTVPKIEFQDVKKHKQKQNPTKTKNLKPFKNTSNIQNLTTQDRESLEKKQKKKIQPTSSNRFRNKAQKSKLSKFSCSTCRSWTARMLTVFFYQKTGTATTSKSKRRPFGGRKFKPPLKFKSNSKTEEKCFSDWF